MPDLTLEITGVEPATRGLAPLLRFKLRVANAQSEEPVHAVLLSAQIQFQCPQRSYTAEEKAKLIEIFGPPEMWNQSLRNRLWVQTNTTICAFRGQTEAVLDVPCTFDLNIAASKYLYALEHGDLSLLFLFSGSVFSESGRQLKVEPISWDKECVYQMPVRVWHELMQQFYGDCAWLNLQRPVFNRLYEFKRQQAFLGWEQTIEALLEHAAKEQRMEVTA